MIIIAHRGESFDAPENTLAAIKLAWQRNADAVEVDVHQSKDDKIVVIHDDNTWKLNRKFDKIKDQTLEELIRLDIGRYKGSQWKNERIPTLEQVLDTVPKKKYLFIEIKSSSKIFDNMRKLIGSSKIQPDRIKFISFDFDVLKKAKKIFDKHEVFWIHNIEYFELMKSWRPEITKIINKTQQANLDGLDLSNSKLIDKTFVDEIKNVGLKLYVWTVNDPVDAKRLFDAGVTGIATDRAQWLKAELRRLDNWVTG